MSSNASDEILGHRHGIYNGIDIMTLNTEDKVKTAFDVFWKKLTSETNEIAEEDTSFKIFETSINDRIQETISRIHQNEVMLQDINRKMKEIDFENERATGKTILNEEKNTNPNEGLEDIKNDIKKLKNKKEDEELFLKRCPGILNFQNTMEDTFSALQQIQEAQGEAKRSQLKIVTQEESEA